TAHRKTLAGVLDDLGRPDVVTQSQVANSANLPQPAFAEWLRDHKTRRKEYVAISNPNDSEGRSKIGGARTRSTARPPSRHTIASPPPLSGRRGGTTMPRTATQKCIGCKSGLDG